MTNVEKEFLQHEFINNIFPVLSPLAVDPGHPFPFIPHAGFALALQLKKTESEEEHSVLLPIPKQLPRFVRLLTSHETFRMLPLEEVLVEYINELFPDYSLINHCT